MRMEKLEVIVCDTIEQFEKKYKKTESKCDVLCLTKNIDLFLKGAKSYKNVEIRILEGQKSYLDYTEQTWDILDEINDCIEQTINEKTYRYQMGCHLEGECEAMHIAEMLMYNDIFDTSFGKYTDVRVTCCYNVIYAKDIEQLYFWCKKNKKKILVDFGKSKWDFTKLRLFILSKFGEKALDVMVESYAFYQNKRKIKKLKRKIKYLNDGEEQQQSTDIGIIKGSAYEKDYNWTKAYLDILSEADIEFRFICVKEEDKQRWESYGYKADNLEKSLPIDVLNNELKNYKIVRRKIHNALMTFLVNSIWVNDARQLKMIVKNFLRYTNIDSIISDVAANEFFKTHHYKILDLHSNTNSMLSRACSFNAKKYSDTVKIRNCTSGLQMVKVLLYEPYGYLSDFGFVSKDMENERSKVEKHRTEYVGRKYEIKNITYSKDFYQNTFDPDLLKKDLCILWAPSYPGIGNISYSNFLQTGLNLIEFFSANSGKFIMKFHPHQREIETNVFKERSKGKSNIIVESSAVNVRKVLDQVDILVTNCSLSTIDAAAKKKAVICVVCEYEYQKIKHHEEGLYITRSYEELNELLRQLEDEAYRKNWVAERIRKQNDYFATLIDSGEGSEKMIRAIKKELSY